MGAGVPRGLQNRCENLFSGKFDSYRLRSLFKGVNMNNNEKNSLLRNIPQVDELLNDDNLINLKDKYSHDYLLKIIQETVKNYKSDLLNDNNLINYNREDLINKILKNFELKDNLGISHVINATGTVLHTNLGRSMLSRSAINAIENVAKNYSDLEYDLESGKRGNRNTHIEKVLKNLLSVESAVVVNNNAAATILVLSTLSKNKEAIVSRGELIEIGDSFRIPDIMSLSGAILKEVGTTNITKINDYKNNINENTSCIMKVHTSNYKICGFAEDVKIEELVKLGKEKNLPVIYDMGNGLFNNLNEYNVNEPTIKEIIDKGVDIVLFSGDKLLGGPQAGIILGKKQYIDKMKTNPYMRAFRVDKFTLAALNATFKEYYNFDQANHNIPTLNMVTKKYEDLILAAKDIKDKINNKFFNIDIIDTKDQIGGGTAPNVFLKGTGLKISSQKINAIKLEKDLRLNKIPIISRIHDDCVVIVTRTLINDDKEVIIEFLNKYKNG